MSTKHSPFDFLKEGNDKEFQQAMKSIDTMYDNLFNGDELDKIFQTFKQVDNPITEPIDEMTKQIFKTDEVPSGPKYSKIQEPTPKYNDDEFVIGEPLYENSNVNHPSAQNPYNYNNYYSNGNPYANPYYQGHANQLGQSNSSNSSKSGQSGQSGENYFGAWKGAHSYTPY